jgi:hypothetical protein
MVLRSWVLNNTDLTEFCDDVEDAYEAALLADHFTDLGTPTVSMLNKTGASSIKGTLIEAYETTGTDLAFKVADIDTTHAIGVVYEAGVSDGDMCRVVLCGLAECLIEAGDTIETGYWARSGSTTAGRVELQVATGGGSIAEHFKEVGHCVESAGVAGASDLARIVLHFN